MSNTPETSPAIRESIREKWKNHTSQSMHQHLQSIDPKTSEKLNPNDTQRIVRALEVMEQTGISLTDWQAERSPPPFAISSYRIGFLDYPRQDVYNHCEERFVHMLDYGLLDEIKAFDSLGLDESLPAMKAHGVPEIRHYLKGEMSLEEAIQKAQLNTRHYIKRQYTWFYHQMPGIHRLKNISDATSWFLKPTK
jgi:tRNA dimethylallyltransferase